MTSDPIWTLRRNRWAIPALVLAIAALALRLCGQLGSILFYQVYVANLPLSSGTVDLRQLFMIVAVVTGLISNLSSLGSFLALILGTAAVVQVRQRPDIETGKRLGLAAIAITLCGWLLTAMLWGAQMAWQLNSK